MTPTHFQIEWFDLGREPQCPANPAYPSGIDVDCSCGGSPSCTFPLPYPAKRCGQYLIKCQVCGMTAIVTTAGRADDPRSLKVKCGIRHPYLVECRRDAAFQEH